MESQRNAQLQKEQMPIVIRNDMTDAMFNKTVECASEAFNKFTDEVRIAAYIKR
jgi:hypothetical protein